MSIDYGFDTNDVIDGLPDGAYKVMVTKEEKKESKAGDYYLQVFFEVVEGEYKGQNVIQNYNIWNSNVQAANIAKSAIKKIAIATGKEVNPTNPMKGRVLTIEVVQNGDFKNIKKYSLADGSTSSAPF